MAEKQEQPEHNLPLEGEGQSKELQRNKRMKCFAYVLAFAVFQTGVILIFVLVFLKIRTPKFRLHSATFENFNVTASSFQMRMNAELDVKNANFGPYKFDNSSITFFYRGAQVGNGFISKASARFRSTKKFNVTIDLSSTKLPSSAELGSDLKSGILPLTSHSTLNGKVEQMKEKENGEAALLGDGKSFNHGGCEAP
ncbi:uncharacterized protein LOC132270237 [Cornus florida]|uniref:uncharacterized protein LOC132270237 n=1 Tax=Cornus florida TaxID=4283 RepID=UPI0028A0B3EF|nr:uncharacterized protein LOC132270237 [Cornus florida]